jgi:hypothetical protein
MGPMFDNEPAAREIFEEWRRNIGDEDHDERIRVSVVENTRDGSDPSYHVHIGINWDAVSGEIQQDDYMMMVSRHHKMVPKTVSEHLQGFKRWTREYGCYLLVPAVMRNNEPFPILELAVKKKQIHFRYIDEITDRNDPDVILVPSLAPSSLEPPDGRSVEPPDAERLTAILADFEHRAMNGAVRTRFDPMILDRLYTVERDAQGLVVPDSVDPILWALAQIEAEESFVEACLSVPLEKLQADYVELLRYQFEPMRKLMTDNDVDVDTFSQWASERADFRRQFTKNADDLLDALTRMWTEYAPIVIFHLTKMQSLKAVYGGSGFPLAQSRFWSNVLLYADTLVVPDPILSTFFMAKTASPEESLYHHFSHCLNAIEYAELATSGLDIPPVVFAPTLGIIYDSFRDLGAEKAGFDTARHMSKLFNFRMKTVDDVEGFFGAAKDLDSLLAAVREPGYFLLNDKVPRVPREQARENLEYISSTFDLPGMSEVDVIRHSFLGRWLQYELLCAQASVLGGLPIMDAPAVWEYFTWGLQFGESGVGDRDSINEIVIQHCVHEALMDFPFIEEISPQAMLEVRKQNRLQDLRALIREGISQVSGTDRGSCEEVGSRVSANMKNAIAAHKESIRELQKLGARIAFEGVGLGASAGLSIAAASNASVPLGIVAAVLQALGVKSVRDITKDGHQLLANIKRHQRNPIGLLFR